MCKLYGTKSQNGAEAWIKGDAVAAQVFVANRAFALNLETVYICEEKMVTSCSGADFKATETGGDAEK